MSDASGRPAGPSVSNAHHGSSGDSPLVSVLFYAIIGAVGASILVRGAARKLDGAVALIEKLVIALSLLGMTFLAFNEYLQRAFKPLFETDLGGLWNLQGQTNLALMLMVVVGFAGASIATRQRKHLSVDAADRILTPGPARVIKRVTALAAALMCLVLAQGSWDFIYADHTHDSFEGVETWSWMAPVVNAGTALMPGEKYGPGTEWETQYDWEDAKYAEGLDFDTMPPAFRFVEPGDPFPLWPPVLALAVFFGIMALRFGALVIVPPPRDESLPAPSGPQRSMMSVALALALPAALAAMAWGLYTGHAALLLPAAILLALMGAPLFVSVGVGTVGAWLIVRDGSVVSVVTDMFEATKKQELLAIPFFVLAGNLMTRGTIAARLIAVAKTLLGRLPGGLGIAGVMACAMFAAVSGSSPVTVIAIGSVLFPMLVKAGYSERYSMGMLTTAGGLGIIIPPSVPMIVYAVIVSGSPELDATGTQTGTITLDPTELFTAGLLPGAFIALALIVYTLVTQLRGNEKAIVDGPNFGSGAWFSDLGTSLRQGVFSLFLPVLILGGIYGLFTIPGTDLSFSFTVTEAAAVAVVYALLVELAFHRELKWKQLPEVFTESAVQMGSLFLIIVLAISLNKFMSFEEIPQMATEWMATRVTTKLGFLAAVTVFLLLLGCVMDILSAILIVAPLLAPMASQYGVHPVHFAIIFIVNLELGYLTPPMGINLFVASTVFDKPITRVIRAVLPFLLLMLLCLVIIVAIPQLSTLLLD